MLTPPTTGLYKEDLYCSNPDNLIKNEIHTLQTPGVDDYHFIIPHAAPFYVETLKVVNHQTGVPYVEGTDYLVGHYFVDAQKSLKRPIAGSIRFLRRSISGQARLEYHTVGGQWGFSAPAILAELTNKQLNPIVRSWEQIDGLPARFPSIAHDQSVDQLVGSDEIVQAIENVAVVMEAAAAGSSESHINNRNNPHGVDKTQVGLSEVVNLPLASLTQALNTTFDGGYTTPRTVYHAINHFALTPLNAHIADKRNPHGTDKQQVGLGNVPNLPLADNQQAIDPLNNAAFMSPYTTALMIQSLLPINRLDNLELALQSFMDRRDNPHGVDAAQVGTLTTSQIQDLIVSAGSGDAIRFGGFTYEQVMDQVVEATEMEEMLNEQSTQFASNASQTNNIEPTFDTDITDLNSERDLLLFAHLYAGIGGYTLTNENGVGVMRHNHPDREDFAVGWPGTVAFLEPAVYMVDAQGQVHSADGPGVHTDFSAKPNFDPANAVASILATRSARYLHLEDGRLVRTTGPENKLLIHSDVDSVWANSEYGHPGEMVIYRTAANQLLAYGQAAFVSNFTALVANLPAGLVIEDISNVAICDSHLAFLISTGEDGEPSWSVYVYSINQTTYALTPVTLPALNPIALSGSHGHLGIVLDDGSVRFFGKLEACEDEIDVPVKAIACGGGFTVIVDDRNNVEFWGDSVDNNLVFNHEVMYEHA